ncbi:MAG: hypothetical protein ACUVQ1_08935 [Candidatus Kapaibacteriales bacterium]
MKIFLLFFFICLLQTLANEDKISSKPFSHVIIKSYEEEVYDEGIYRLRYSGFKLFKGDELIGSVGECWDKPPELLLPASEIKIVTRNPKSRKIDTFVYNITPNSISYIDFYSLEKVQ